MPVITNTTDENLTQARAGTDPAQTFWTGGWDSTFRVLWLLFEEKATVQPHYIYDKRRKSAPQECATMDAIRAAIAARDPEAAARLLPTQGIAREDIPANQARRDAYEEIREQSKGSQQYKYLSDYSDMVPDRCIEIGIEVQGEEGTGTINFLRELLEWTEYGGKLRPNANNPQIALFHSFRFPLMRMCKRDMETVARGCSWGDLLALTVFCQRPRPNGTACGRCHACAVTGHAGYLKRMPLRARIRWRLKMANIRLRQRLLRNP
jgi:7-cyano-7-deazaguanine synthase in queuosine biosynthesis